MLCGCCNMASRICLADACIEHPEDGLPIRGFVSVEQTKFSWLLQEISMLDEFHQKPGLP